MGMALSSLLICCDPEAMLLRPILEQSDWNVEQCEDAQAARVRLAAQRFQLVVVDCGNEAAAKEIMSFARSSSAEQQCLVVALLNRDSNVRELFAGGASFVLYKPISAERAASSLRSARSLVGSERRQSRRIPLNTNASIAYGRAEAAPIRLVDLSENGAAIHSDLKLERDSKVFFEFTLPGQTSTIRLSGNVLWQDSSGRAGVRFLSVPPAAESMLKQWMKDRSSNADGEKTKPIRKSPVTEETPEVASAALPDLVTERRVRSRHSCCLSVEVVGSSGETVTRRCSLTDVSEQGCYVETFEPFPCDTEVQILVHTRNLEVKIAGVVKSIQPGMGMAVVFDAGSELKKEQIHQLLATQVFQAEMSV
jgi:CheY-like chemotaxis protein